MKTKLHFSSKNHIWETPQALFDVLNSEFQFTLDAAADANNHKCDVWFSEENNALNQKWRGSVFCNPPYGKQLSKFIEKAYFESRQDYNNQVVMLIPARTDTKAWHKYVFPYAEIRFLKGRVKFELKGEVLNSALFPSAVVIFKKGGNRMKILDACCGSKMFWFDKQNPDVTFMDIRELETNLCDGRKLEIKPDVLGDFRDMPFGNETFDLVVFDPPHVVYDSGNFGINDAPFFYHPNSCELVESLEKPTVPQCFDDWYKKTKGDTTDKIFILVLDYFNYVVAPDFRNWIEENKKVAIDAILNGYEVEVEQLYYVKLPAVISSILHQQTDNGKLLLLSEYKFDAGYKYKFTKSEIKAIDEWYWKFAVPVEEDE